jgi:molecular chaperone IbpA
MMTRNNLSFTYPRSIFVGFESLFNDLERLTTSTPGQDNYPPHNVVKIDDEHFNIEMAVAGFSKDDIEVELKDGTLLISGERSEDEREYAYKGISSRKFSKSFRLAEYVVTDGADLVDGILVVNLRVDIPEEKRPQKIKIGS